MAQDIYDHIDGTLEEQVVNLRAKLEAARQAEAAAVEQAAGLARELLTCQAWVVERHAFTDDEMVAHDAALVAEKASYVVMLVKREIEDVDPCWQPVVDALNQRYRIDDEENQRRFLALAAEKDAEIQHLRDRLSLVR